MCPWVCMCFVVIHCCVFGRELCWHEIKPITRKLALVGISFFVWSSCQFFYLFVWSSCQFFYLFVWSSCQFFYLFVWSSCQFFYLFVWSSCQFFYLFVWSSCQFFYLFVWSSCQFFYLFVWFSYQFFYFCRRKGKRICLNRLRLERKCEITISKAFWVWEGRGWQKFFLFFAFFFTKFFFMYWLYCVLAGYFFYDFQKKSCVDVPVGLPPLFSSVGFAHRQKIR